MTPAQEKHLSRYPHARPSTLARIGAKEQTTAQLAAEVEARIDRQIAAAFRTFAINVWRAEKAGRL